MPLWPRRTSFGWVVYDDTYQTHTPSDQPGRAALANVRLGPGAVAGSDEDAVVTFRALKTSNAYGEHTTDRPYCWRCRTYHKCAHLDAIRENA